MPLPQSDIDAIRATTPVLSADPDAVAAAFYGRLFEKDPALRTLFRSDMTDQGRKLMATLAVAVSALDAWEKLSPILADLARRHVSYGVKAEHYPLVGAALLDTLAGAGASTAQLDAWGRAYSAISGHMTAAAYPADQVA